MMAARATRRRRERSLRNEVRLLRRIVAVVLRDKADLQRIVDDTSRDIRNGVPLATHIQVCQSLHVAESRIRCLEEDLADAG
jgi:hypothetical protein